MLACWIWIRVEAQGLGKKNHIGQSRLHANFLPGTSSPKDGCSMDRTNLVLIHNTDSNCVKGTSNIF